MLQTIRNNSKGVIAKIIVGFIAIIFALFGLGSLSEIGSGPRDPIEVNGQGIAQQELERAMFVYRSRLEAQLGDNADPAFLTDTFIRGQVVEDLVSREIIRQWAEQEGFYFADDKVGEFTVQMPDFQNEQGQFDKELFVSRIRMMGYTSSSFAEQLREDLIFNQIRIGFSQTAFATQTEMKLLSSLQNQTRSVRLLEISVAEGLADIEVSEADQEDYYAENEASFLEPEKIKVAYIELRKEDFLDQVEVDEDEVKARVEDKLAAFDEQEERRSAHILIEVNDSVGDEQALQEIQALKQQIDDGEDFGRLAKEHSADLGSAQQGGDLGFNSRGIFDPDFEEALFALIEAGQVSEPVRTEYGYHLIRLSEIKQAQAPDPATLESQARAEISEGLAMDIFLQRQEELANAVYSADSLEEPAAEFELEVKTSSFFDQRGGGGLFSNKALLDAAFAIEVKDEGNNSDPVEVGPDHVVVVRVLETQPERIKTLEEVKAQVVSRVKVEKAREQADSLADSYIEQLQAGANYEEIGQDKQLIWRIADKLKRDSSELPRHVVQAAFQLSKPEEGAIEYIKTEPLQGKIGILVLTGVEDASTDTLDETEVQAIHNRLRTEQARRDFTSFFDALRDEAEVEQL